MHFIWRDRQDMSAFIAQHKFVVAVHTLSTVRAIARPGNRVNSFLFSLLCLLRSVKSNGFVKAANRSKLITAFQRNLSIVHTSSALLQHGLYSLACKLHHAEYAHFEILRT